MLEILLLMSVLMFIYGSISSKFSTWIISAPILFLLIGVVSGPFGFQLLSVDEHGEGVSELAELALAVILFSDASMTNTGVLKRHLGLPERLLLAGLPLTIMTGFFAAWLLFPELLWIEAAIIAIILAPTDAALGKPVVVNRKVPASIRESLNLESGLNDGICVPFILIAIAIVQKGLNQMNTPIAQYFLEAIGVGLGIGLAVSFLGSRLILFSISKKMLTKNWKPVILILLPFAIYAIAEMLGGSGFIACFTGGLGFGRWMKSYKEELIHAPEGFGDILSLSTWMFFGAVAIHYVYEHITLPIFVYSLLSLTIVRMIPVFISLLGSETSTLEKVFIGWFGPRGLASIVFLALVVNYQLDNQPVIVTTVACTILLSVLLHGITANPLINGVFRNEE